MHESIIFVLLSPTGIAHKSAIIILHVYCATYTYDPPRPPPCVCHTLYNIGNAISCRGQVVLILPTGPRTSWCCSRNSISPAMSRP